MKRLQDSFFDLLAPIVTQLHTHGGSIVTDFLRKLIDILIPMSA